MFSADKVAVEGAAVYKIHIPSALSQRSRFDWLSPEEVARAALIGNAARRAQFAAGRWLLRHTADEVFGKAQYVVRAVEGRPEVCASNGLPAAASLSHSGGLAICAAGSVRALGVDIEKIRPRADWEGLAAWVLHPSEQERLAGCDASQRWQRFYQSWTFKEALAKAIGVGVFGLPFSSIALSEDGAIEESPKGHGLHTGDWQLRLLHIHPGFAAAVAWRP